MFEKLLSLLPYNPGLAQQVRFYSQRMREEAAIRRTGMVFIVLAFMVQFFAVLAPPAVTSADVNSPNNNLITGGVFSAAAAKSDCDNNIENYRNILNYYGISCADLGNATLVSINSKTTAGGNLFSMGRWPCGKATHNAACSGNPTAPQEQAVTQINGTNAVYWRKLASFDSFAQTIANGSPYTALKFVSSKTNQTFWIETLCGNLVSVGVPTPYTPPSGPKPNPIASPPNLPVTPTKTPPTSTPPVISHPEVAPDLGVNPPVCGSTILQGWASEDEANSNELINVYIYANGPPDNPANPGSGTYIGLTSNANPNDPKTGLGYPETNPSWTFNIPKQYQNSSTKFYIYAVNQSGATTGPGVTGSGPFYGSDPETVPACTSTPAPTAPPVTTAPAPPPTTPIVNQPACQGNGSTTIGDTDQCKPCPASTSNQDTADCIVIHKTAANSTQNVSDASSTTANPGDVIVYTLFAQNTGKVTMKDFSFQENLSDVLIYANVTDFHGGSLDSTSGTITWPNVDIAAGATASVQVSVTVKNPIPQTPASPVNPALYDLVMSNTYGNTINIKVPSPTVTTAIAATAATLPNTGPGTGLFFAAIVVMVAGYFYARSRLLARESALAIQNIEA